MKISTSNRGGFDGGPTGGFGRAGAAGAGGAAVANFEDLLAPPSGDDISVTGEFQYTGMSQGKQKN